MRVYLKDGNKIEITVIKNENNLYEYYFDNTKIGVLDPKVMEENIIVLQNTLENELSSQIKDAINQLPREEIESESRENKQLDNYMKEHGINDAKQIVKIDLNQKIKEKNENNEKKEEDKTLQVGDKNERKQEKVLTTKDVNIKQELKMDVMATDLKTIGQLLEKNGKMPKVEGKTFKKLGIVESTAIKNAKGNTNTTRFSFVAIANDGTVMPVDLEQDYQEGNNPREINYEKKANNTIGQDDVLSRYRIGSNNETISIKTSNGPGNIEVFYSPGKTIGGNSIEGNVSIDQQLETDNVYWKTRKEMRQSEFEGYKHVEDEQREAQGEQQDISGMKRGKKDDKIVNSKESDSPTNKEVDGDEKTKTHDHIQKDSQVLDEYVSKILENDKIAITYNREDVKKTILEKVENNEELTDEELLQQVEEDMEASAESEHEMPSPSRNNH